MFGNLAVAFAVTALQVAALIVAAVLRGDPTSTPRAGGVAWFVAAAALLAIGMYGVAETLANRIPRQEEYIAAAPAHRDRALVLRRLAVPDRRAARRRSTAFAKVLPLTHALALMRYGLARPTAARACTTSGGWATRPPRRRSASGWWRSSRRLLTAVARCGQFNRSAMG